MRATLRDGTEMVIRPIEPDDKELLREHFEHLGEDSRYRRFLAPHGALTEREVHYFTEVDHVHHEALFALDARTGAAVGVARYVADPSAPEIAELAVAVVDDFQGRGVGSILTRALVSRARANGVRRMTACILGSNRPMIALLQELGDARLVDRDGGTCTFELDLPEQGLGSVGELLRAAARD